LNVHLINVLMETSIPALVDYRHSRQRAFCKSDDGCQLADMRPRR
jgi:hypothetical protein